MNPNEAAKQIGTELGQSNPRGDARLAAALAQPTTQHTGGFVVKVGTVAELEYAIVVRPSDGAEICTAERNIGAKFWKNVEFSRPEYLKSNPTRQAAMRALQTKEDR